MILDKARIIVDFNELINYNLVLLAKNDTKLNSEDDLIIFYEGMLVNIYSNDDLDDNGNTVNLIADGIAIKNTTQCFPYVKWLCQIDDKGIRRQSK